MKPWARWTVGTVAVGIALFLGVGAIASAIDSMSQLSATTDDAARRALQLSVAGQLLKGAGIVGIFVAVTLHVVYWDDFKRLLVTSTLVPGGRQGHRRAARQINGTEPFRVDEIPHLRRLAERRVTNYRWSPATWVTFIALIAFYAGTFLEPPEFGVGSAWGPALTQVLKIGSGVMALVFLALLVTGVAARLRHRTDTKAEAFLQRTQPVSWPPDGCN